MQTTGAIGVMVGGMFATNLGHMTPFGYDGWRVALHIVAALSVITGMLWFTYQSFPTAPDSITFGACVPLQCCCLQS